mmetsp:Transcript_58372/g.125572  ORF Transcript_58372/g.125572 Transcript_58372/m.125572 type:complete len:218 (+) Transcript_58372:2271-2924(+)
MPPIITPSPVITISTNRFKNQNSKFINMMLPKRLAARTRSSKFSIFSTSTNCNAVYMAVVATQMYVIANKMLHTSCLRSSSSKSLRWRCSSSSSCRDRALPSSSAVSGFAPPVTLLGTGCKEAASPSATTESFALLRIKHEQGQVPRANRTATTATKAPSTPLTAVSSRFRRGVSLSELGPGTVRAYQPQPMSIVKPTAAAVTVFHPFMPTDPANET